MQISRIVINIRKLMWPRTLKSSPASKVLRPIFENKNIKKILGGMLIFLVIFGGGQEIQAAAYQKLEVLQNEEEMAIPLESEELPVKTLQGIQIPLADFEVTQGYWFFHQAIDMAAPIGTEIKAIKEGGVLTVSNGGWPWGKSVLIDHGSGLESFYAHLSKVEVEEGQEIGLETVIGKVGSTGRSTGDHLHLEIKVDGEAIDPREFIVTDRK